MKRARKLVLFLLGGKKVNKNIKLKDIRKKIIVIMFLIILLFNTSQPIFAITDSGSDRWVPGQWASQIYTTDSKGSTGMIMRRLTSYNTQEQVTTFCAEFGVEAETRCNCYRNTFCTI